MFCCDSRCFLTVESVLVRQNVFSYDRMCSLRLGCASPLTQPHHLARVRVHHRRHSTRRMRVQSISCALPRLRADAPGDCGRQLRPVWLRRHSTLHNTPTPMHLTPYTSAPKPFPTPQPLNPSLHLSPLTLDYVCMLLLCGCAGTLHYTIHPSPYTLHPTPYNLQPTSRTSHPPCTFTLIPQLLYTLP